MHESANSWGRVGGCNVGHRRVTFACQISPREIGEREKERPRAEGRLPRKRAACLENCERGENPNKEDASAAVEVTTSRGRKEEGAL